ncbi:hypothetical protein [Leptolyngbya phage Lbo-JY46]
MFIEFFARFVKEDKPKTKKQLEAEAEKKRIKYLTTGMLDNEWQPNEPVKIKYEYVPIVIDVKTDVKLFNYYDEVHTTVQLYGGAAYVLKIPYENFKPIFELSKGNLRVVPFTDFVVTKEEAEKNHQK